LNFVFEFDSILVSCFKLFGFEEAFDWWKKWLKMFDIPKLVRTCPKQRKIGIPVELQS
jgi:hypothetical protein